MSATRSLHEMFAQTRIISWSSGSYEKSTTQNHFQ